MATLLRASVTWVHVCLQINGSLTLGENIADNGGVKAAFQVHVNLYGLVEKKVKETIDVFAINFIFHCAR